jgi:hypothetical protein
MFHLKCELILEQQTTVAKETVLLLLTTSLYSMGAKAKTILKETRWNTAGQ